MSNDTRTGLLLAAEKLLVEEGVLALSVRRIGQVSGLNPTLVTYHFGSISALLAELLDRNISPMRHAWGIFDGFPHPESVEHVLECWLQPLTAPAAFHPSGRALVVIDEIASHGSGELSAGVMAEMVSVAKSVSALLQPLLPHLEASELRERLRLIAGAALGPPPRAAANLGHSSSMEREARTKALVRFAMAALSRE